MLQLNFLNTYFVSIARFREIENNQGFAEYYLIGTLYSVLYVVSMYNIIFS